MRKNLFSCWTLKLFVHKIARRKNLVLFLLLVLATLAALPGSWWLAKVVSRILMLPQPPEQDLGHFQMNRSLRQYLDKIVLLIEPTSTSCETLSSFPVLILVASVPKNFQHRAVIRSTWAKYQPTYFVMGTHGFADGAILQGNYMEAKQYKDIIVYDFTEHYQNLTLKTALMLRWASVNCPQIDYLLKTDDDVLVNPWTLKKVVKDHPNSDLLGYSINNSRLHRDQYNKYYVPRWLYRENSIDQYLSGTAYLVNGAHINRILKASYDVPLVNVEDVYITNLVARRALNLTLTHDRRLSPKKPWISFACAYWSLATAHSFRPVEIFKIWPGIKALGKNPEKSVCSGYDLFSRDFFLY